MGQKWREGEKKNKMRFDVSLLPSRRRFCKLVSELRIISEHSQEMLGQEKKKAYISRNFDPGCSKDQSQRAMIVTSCLYTLQAYDTLCGDVICLVEFCALCMFLVVNCGAEFSQL